MARCALVYAAAFTLLGRAGPALGAAFGLLQAAVALTNLVPLLAGVHPRMASERAGPQTVGAVLEPPGLFGRNYGRQTAIVTAVAQLGYGALLGLLLKASSPAPRREGRTRPAPARHP
jgi:hypothetical protein